ncbi:hypothetical protein MLD38_017117 [Melastoma candidum]|uniref:Uncharacterized protein n=1 Tax=Melastoma candidum TaxID=119954 RepID=A0ACB9QPL1_9MYRT|nr:hypothetical protein MLD38_017117 [Melastoma candidum]
MGKNMRRGMALRLASFFLLGCLLCCRCEARSGSGTSKQKLDVKNHLKRLNKPPLKSIKSPDGDVIDCVHISKQPAFDHPFLKDHEIQMKPSYHPGRVGGGQFDEDKKAERGEKSVTQLWHVNGRCPDGTIPIRRTKEEDVLRASSIKRYGKKKHGRIPTPPRSADPGLINTGGHQHAIAFVEGEKFGSWVAPFGGDLNSIEAGWQVSPELYGDNNTRLFTYWTSDAYQATGCYNLLCSGFIQINSEIAMGASISPVSAYRNPQYDIGILVWKDPSQGHWWMQFGDGHVMGYWPSFMFTYLGEGASMIEWGGEIVNAGSRGEHTLYPDGQRAFPGGRDPRALGTFTEKPDCYGREDRVERELGSITSTTAALVGTTNALDRKEEKVC